MHWESNLPTNPSARLQQANSRPTVARPASHRKRLKGIFASGLAIALSLPAVSSAQQRLPVDPEPIVEEEVVDFQPGRVRRAVPHDCNVAAPKRCLNQFWAEAEYLLWWPNGASSLPIVTTSLAGTSAANSGVIGLGTTSVLSDFKDLANDPMNGFRVGFGFWDQQGNNLRGWEGNYLNIQSSSQSSFNSTDNPILARPYVDGATGNTAAAFLVAHPTFLSGVVDVAYDSQLQGAEATRRVLLCQSSKNRWDMLLGYRYLDLDESLGVQSFSTFTAAQGQILAGTTKSVLDQFSTSNTFHGGQIGLAYRERCGAWNLNLQTKLAIGGMQAATNINGSTTNTVPAGGGTTTFAGGLFAQTTNIGSYEIRKVSVAPELRIALSRRLHQRLTTSIGYNLLAITNVARLSEQVDPILSQLPPQAAQGAGRPLFTAKTGDYVVQGLNVGLMLEF